MTKGRVKETQDGGQAKKRKRMTASKWREIAFYVLILAFPVIQFSVFYIGVNFNSFLLAFKKIDVLENTTVFTFDNIKNAFKLLLFDEGILTALAVP